MITDKMLKSTVETSSTLQRGEAYYRSGRVKNLRLDKENFSISARVMGTVYYDVSVYFNTMWEIEDYDCDCPAYHEYAGACKHIVAVLRYMQTNWNSYFRKNSGILGKNELELLNYFERMSGDMQTSCNAKIIPEYHFDLTYNGQKSSYLDFSVGNVQRMYVLRDIQKFLIAVRHQTPLSYGKSFTYDYNTVFDTTSQALVDMMTGDNPGTAHGYYYGGAERVYALNNINIHKFFDIMKDNSFIGHICGKAETIHVEQGNPPFRLDVAENGETIKTTLDLQGSRYYGLDNDFRHIYHKGVIYKTTEEFARTVKPLFKCFAAQKFPEISIPKSEASRFFVSVLPQLQKAAEVSVDTALNDKYVSEPLTAKIYLDRLDDGISARLEFSYGDLVFHPLKNEYTSTIEGKTVLRNLAKEKKICSVLEKQGFQAKDALYTMFDDNSLFEFLTGGVNELTSLGEVFYSDAFKNMTIRDKGRISAGVRFSMDSDSLELTLQYEDTEGAELSELLHSYKLKRRFHRLKNGSFVTLTQDSGFDTAATLLEQMDVNHLKEKTVSLPKYRAMYIESLAKEENGLKLTCSDDFKSFTESISKPGKSSFPVPKEINGELRDYQKTGFKWLKTLSHYGMGGILADDMGLGKTLQVLAFILSEKGKGRMPSIVVAPTSLVYNWLDEVRKFTPQLKAVAVSGTVKEREEQLKEAADADLVITSYALIRRDMEKYSDFTFNYCFADEAQHIKNHNTQNAQAVKSLNAKGCFALTGTPVENSLAELWSIFDFVLPGYLHNHTKFSVRYENPIVRNDDKSAKKELSRHISPFIMRRLKKDVLKELPEKIESRMICGMTAEQSKLYDAYLMKAKSEFEEEIAANGFDRSQIKILALLTRLRQLCCHPSLFLENYKGKSGKMETLSEVLADARIGGHRVLLFSQFTSMLNIIRTSLDKEKISHFYLDGSTKPMERMNMVNAFNQGERDVFLISLKAGGTGLNLTGADMVIHFDPWWNPAVEDQATDRAYRIGQQNVVQVFKLIAKGTIEEKIFELQQKKKELIDSVIKPGESFISKMKAEDIRSLFER